MATLVHILTAPSPEAAPQFQTSARAVPGRGLEGDRYFSGTGTFSPHPPKPDFEITLIERESITQFADDSGLPFSAEDARRNLVTEGVALNALVGREFSVGEVRLRGLRLCEPCNYLAKQTHPSVLRGLVHRGGLRAQILTGGVIRVGDLIAPVHHELAHADYLLSDDPGRLDIDAVHAYLTTSYWAAGIPRDTVARSLANSLALGIYAPPEATAKAGAQVGLVRVISDYATFAYLCDVYVLETHRGRGLSKAAIAHLATHPRLQNLRRQHLVTQDAHGLYSQFGFTPLSAPERHMEKCDFGVYRRPPAAP